MILIQFCIFKKLIGPREVRTYHLKRKLKLFRKFIVRVIWTPQLGHRNAKCNLEESLWLISALICKLNRKPQQNEKEGQGRVISC